MAHNEFPVERFNVKIVNLEEDVGNIPEAPTTSTSGACLYTSGGAIYGKGTGGTITQIAAA